MLIYMFIAILLFLGTFAKQAKLLYYLGLFSLWGLMAFRHIDMGGMDAGFYQYFYEIVPNIFDVWGWESNYTWAYTLLNALVKTVSDQYIAFQIVYSVIAFVILYQILEKLDLSYQQKCLFLLSFYCFRYMWDMWIILRQNIADLLFWLFSYVLYGLWKKTGSEEYNRKLKIGACIVVLIFLSSGFHSSAWLNLVFLPILYYISRINLKKKTIMIVFASLFVYFILSPSFAEILSMISMVDNRYMMYANTEGEANHLYYLMRMVIFLFFSYNYYRISSKEKEYFFDMMGVMVLVGSINAPIVVRFVDYYAIGMYGLISFLPSIFVPNNRIPVLAFSLCIMLLVLYRFLIILDGGALLDYRLGI